MQSSATWIAESTKKFNKQKKRYWRNTNVYIIYNKNWPNCFIGKLFDIAMSIN